MMIHPDRVGCFAPAVAARDAAGRRLPLQVIHAYVMIALDGARKQPDKMFRVQQDGWGYSPDEIAPLFAGAPDNVVLPWGKSHA